MLRGNLPKRSAYADSHKLRGCRKAVSYGVNHASGNNRTGKISGKYLSRSDCAGADRPCTNRVRFNVRVYNRVLSVEDIQYLSISHKARISGGARLGSGNF